MKVLVLSTNYPNDIKPALGTFVEQQIKELTKHCDIVVVSPVSLTPPLEVLRKLASHPKKVYSWIVKRLSIAKVKTEKNLSVFYPRMFQLPKVLFHFTDGLLYFIFVFNVVRKLRSLFDFDLINAFFAFPDGMAAVLLGKIFKRPVVVTCEGSDINVLPEKNRLLRWQIAITLRNCESVIAVSSALRDKIIELGIPEHKLKVIPNGVDIGRFRPRDKQEVRHWLDINPSDSMVLFVGNLFPIKGLRYLLEAICKVNGEAKNLKLFIVGSGFLREKLLDFSRAHKLDKQVHFVGSEPHDRIPIWMSACDLLILPSLNEGWPTVISEALACGTPVVASRVGGVPEVISDDRYGIIVEPKNSTALAQAICEGLNKKWDTTSIVEYAQRYTWEIIAKSVFQEYKNACGEKDD